MVGDQSRPNLYGYNVSLRSTTQTSGAQRTYIDTERPLRTGTLLSYYAYAHPSNVARTVRLQIWRPVNTFYNPDQRYTLVWERRVQLDPSTTGAFYTVRGGVCN